MVDASILRCCSSFFQAPPEGCKPDHAGSHKGENTRFRHRRTDHVLSMVRGVSYTYRPPTKWRPQFGNRWSPIRLVNSLHPKRSDPVVCIGNSRLPNSCFLHP